MSNLIGQQRAPQATYTSNNIARPGANLTPPPSGHQGMPRDTVTLGGGQDDGLSKMNCLKDWAVRNAAAKPGEHTPLTSGESICLETVDKIKEMKREQFLQQRGNVPELHNKVRDLMMN